MKKFYQALQNIGPCTAGEVYQHTWTERTPDGDAGLKDVKGYDMRIKATLLHDSRYFKETDIVSPSDPRLEKKVQVEIIQATGHELRADRALFVTVDPAFGEMCPEIRDVLVELIGHERVEVIPLPKGTIQFFQVEHPYVISVDPSVLGGSSNA